MGPRSPKGRIQFGITVALWIPALCWGVPGESSPRLTLPELLEKFGQKQGEIRTWTFRFRQTVRRPGLPVEHWRGRGWYERGDRWRLILQGPQTHRVFAEGEKIWVYTPALKQQLVGRLEELGPPVSFPWAWVEFVLHPASERVRNSYDILFGGWQENRYRVDLKPKSKANPALAVWLSDPELRPVRGRYEMSGVHIDLELFGLQYNPVGWAPLNNPEPPPGTEIINWTPMQ